MHSEKENQCLFPDASVTSSKAAAGNKITELQSKINDISLNEGVKSTNHSASYSPLKSFMHSKHPPQNHSGIYNNNNSRSSPKKSVQSFQPIEPQAAFNNHNNQKRKPRTSVGEFLSYGTRFVYLLSSVVIYKSSFVHYNCNLWWVKYFYLVIRYNLGLMFSRKYLKFVYEITAIYLEEIF